MTQEATNNVLVIKNARLSFPDIWTPTDFKGNKQFNYRATLLIPKTDAVTLSAIDKIMLELCNDKFGSKKGSANSRKRHVFGIAVVCFGVAV